MTKSSQTGKDLISRLGPDERFWVIVGNIEVVVDSGFQFSGTAMDATSQLLLCEGGKEALDEVKPR